MKAPSPAFSFYPGDWLRDAKVRAMTPAARGIYVDLLCHQWFEGSIPDPAMKGNLARLARMTSVAISQFRKAWPEISSCFERDEESGNLVQGRMEAERHKQKSRQARASAGGKAKAGKAG